MLKVSDLPTDVNGIVQGAYRLVHEDPNYCGGLGPLHMRNGVTTEPVTGRMLRVLVGEYGPRLFAELWTGPLPANFHLPELVRADVPIEQLGRLERAPWRDVGAALMMPLTVELLKVGGDSAPADFARTIEDVPGLRGNDAIQARAFYIEKAAAMRLEGYVEIPAVLDGFVKQLDAIIANEPPTAPPDASATASTAALDDLPPVLEDLETAEPDATSSSDKMLVEPPKAKGPKPPRKAPPKTT